MTTSDLPEHRSPLVVERNRLPMHSLRPPADALEAPVVNRHDQNIIRRFKLAAQPEQNVGGCCGERRREPHHQRDE